MLPSCPYRDTHHHGSLAGSWQRNTSTWEMKDGNPGEKWDLSPREQEEGAAHRHELHLPPNPEHHSHSAGRGRQLKGSLCQRSLG